METKLESVVQGGRRRGLGRVARGVRTPVGAAMATAAVIGIVLVVVVVGYRRWTRGGGGEPSCAEAFAQQRWAEASLACARQVERTQDALSGVRTATALVRLERYDEALALAQRWYGSSEDATARQVAGAVYLERDDLTRAIAMLETALAEHVGRFDHVEASHDESYLAGAFLHAGLLGDAVEASQGAVREADLAGPGDAYAQMRGRARLKLGKLMIEVGDFTAAQAILWEAQQVLAASIVDQAWVFLWLGELLQARDDRRASAAQLFERALALATAAGVAPVVKGARLNLAYARRELGQLDAAEYQLRSLDDAVHDQPTALFLAGLIAADRGRGPAAEQLLARAAASAPGDDYAMDIALQRGRLAERAGDPAIAEQRYREAVALVDKLRDATDTLELRPLILARRRAPYRALISLLARQNRRVDALLIAEQLHARSRYDVLVGHTGEAAVRARVSAALSLGRRLHATAAPSLDELLAVMRGREILVFAEAGADLWRFHIVDGAVVRLDLVPPRAQPLLERWRTAPDDRALADELGELLIPPAAAAPSPQPLYLVTSGTLDALPFAALRCGGRFLVEDRALARLPHVAALRCPPRRLARRSSVFLGDSRDDLPAARKETRALSALFDARALVGTEATVERLEASRDAALLHLAVHADVDRTGARLLLASQRQVTAAEIVERDVGPRVAVLAGCATAIGRDSEGWGALSSAFLTAGSRSVVGTLQAVNDTDAFEIMRRFYRHGGDRQPAAALAAAQRELLASPPSTWAGFVVHGSADAADCEGTP